jgi:hypothetical protein
MLGYESIPAGLAAVFADPLIIWEVREICTVQLEAIDFVDEPVSLGFECPLDLHCAYSRDQLMVGLGEYNQTENKAFREGAKWISFGGD